MVSLGDVTVGEGRTVSQVTSVVSRYLPGFQGCHDKALRAGSSSTGEVVVDFTILDFGEVTSVSAENHLPDAEVAACITRILKLIRFPALDRPLFPPPAKEIPVAVRVPLVLRVAPRKP